MNENITILKINDNIKNTLIDNTILTIRDLSNKTKNELKGIGLNQDEVKMIEVQMQLNGFKLRKSL